MTEQQDSRNLGHDIMAQSCYAFLKFLSMDW